eukprot:TRINITY_DN14320_c0_g1_i1.p1 TRINITY_DN14320_c0_g1~~TRINITY_DN14320_c0_g1_i1.p1  ORF type:complete len:149 (+),score=29.55 TRINITY_DN14320_c0_g1_i1:51-449(+)
MGKQRMSKAAKLRKQEEMEMAEALREEEAKRVQVALGNEHSRMLSEILSQAGRIEHVQGVEAGEYQTNKYLDSECASCRRPWAAICGMTGLHHTDQDGPPQSPWRCNRLGSPPVDNPSSSPGKSSPGRKKRA